MFTKTGQFILRGGGCQINKTALLLSPLGALISLLLKGFLCVFINLFFNLKKREGLQMAVTLCENGKFVPIRSGEVCPVCGSKKGRCSAFYKNDRELAFYRCKYKESHRPSNGWYIHTAYEVHGIRPDSYNKRHTLPDVEVGEETEEMTEERKRTTDFAYRYLRELVRKYEGAYLNVRDRKNLLDRGLTDELMERMMLFSVPTVEIASQEELDSFKLAKHKNLYVTEKKYTDKPIKVMVRNYNDGGKVYDCQLQTAISKDMERKFGEDLLKVAGFIKKTASMGNDYITFKTRRYDPANSDFVPIRGYFIPYINSDGQILGLQYRLTVLLYDEDGKQMRYFWYSSKNARSGSPIDYYIPSKMCKDKDRVRDDIILVTEGALKGKIAAEKLGFKVVSEAGVSNYRRLVDTIIEISQKEGMRHNIILALDMDRLKNIEVAKAEYNTAKLLIQAGYKVAVAIWDRSYKGIDDNLNADGWIEYMNVPSENFLKEA